MKWYWLTLIIWTLVNLTVLAWIGYSWIMRTCDWCHRRYIVWTSTSATQNVFCSYRCNYWDLRAYLGEEMHLDLLEVEEYLSRRGYAHPDLVEVKK